jgi:hypothetical protein
VAGQLEENGSNNAQNELTSEAAGLDNGVTIPMTTNNNNIATLDPLVELNEDLLMGNEVHEEAAIQVGETLIQNENLIENPNANAEITTTHTANTTPTTNPPVCSPHGFKWYQEDRAILSENKRNV